MAEAFLKDILDKLRSLITEEVGLILGVDKEMKKLSNTLITLQAELKDTEIKQIVNRSFRDWVQKLGALAYKIDDILDECNTHGSKLNKLSRYSPRNMFYSRIIRGRMKRVTEKLEVVATESAKFATESAKFQMPADKPREVVVPPSRETISLLTQYDQIYDREEDKEKIVQILVNDVKEDKGISVLPIIGVGGIGKTTLAKLVYNDPRVGEHYDIRIWVYVSKNFELKTLLKAMIEDATGSAVALGQLDVLQRELRKLLSQKRYLIVLDDVWNEDQEKWFKLKNILSCGSTGASIIVTARQNKVAHIMGTLPAHRLKRLSDENCWMLLRSRAFGPNEEVSPHLEIIGKEIVKKCVGVPLIAEALGGILRFKRTREEWLYVKEDELHNLQLRF
ncbi:putative disease resistance protein RGA3 [Salvia hispanica]|uniref:putative disease resistance protein RGA3 n=1 Tax=Salvia hispanica TaxID=49212 RepID=UPI002009A974|nr:putative disease resistance protein RGA3 [Salvia hispanica]